MPELGEKKRQRDLGYRGRGYLWYIWQACEDCDKKRWVRCIWGKPERTICPSCAGRRSHPRTGGSRANGSSAYISVRLQPDDFFYPMARKDGLVFEHRLVMARHLNRCLLPWEVVHHKNGNKKDNRLEMLELLSGNSKHNKLLNREIKRLQRRVAELEQALALTR